MSATLAPTLAPTREETQYDVAVRDAAQLLDDYGPEGWRTRIDLDALNLVSCDQCILGQVFGGFTKGLDVIGLGGLYPPNNPFSGIDAQEKKEAWTRYLSGAEV